MHNFSHTQKKHLILGYKLLLYNIVPMHIGE